MKSIKKIKRKPGASPTGNMYFTLDTQSAIIEFQSTDKKEEKERLYNEQIRSAFERLVENLIFVYGFQTPHEPTSVLHADCVSFLFEALKKWKPDRGTKAFSYFNVVAKNWLIMNSKKRQKHAQRMVSFDNQDLLTNKDVNQISKLEVALPIDDLLNKEESKKEIMRALSVIKSRLSLQNEHVCIDAIATMFENIDRLDFLNKRAVFIYVRELSGLDKKELSIALSSIRRHYKAVVGTESFNIF